MRACSRRRLATITRAIIATIRPLAALACIATLVSCKPATASVLLFAGDGTSRGDIVAMEAVLDRAHVSYATVTTSQLNRMRIDDLAAYQLLVVPGGNFIDMSASLTTETTTRVRDAVHRGLNYFGICAGAFIAGDGRGAYNGINLTDGARFAFYSLELQGTRKAAVPLARATADAASRRSEPSIEHYWEDGPELTGWGAVVARYPDGTPAVVEGEAGKGWVILTGVHPEAPASWRRGMTFTTSADSANAYAVTLVMAALRRTVLPHY